MKIKDYLNLKNFNDLLKVERKMTFDINIDHLSAVVLGSDEKIKNLDCKYLEIKSLLDRMIRKNDFVSKTSLNATTSNYKPVQCVCPISIDNNESVNAVSKPNVSNILELNKENKSTQNKSVI